jgi:hypothetical protein
MLCKAKYTANNYTLHPTMIHSLNSSVNTVREIDSVTVIDWHEHQLCDKEWAHPSHTQ